MSLAQALNVRRATARDLQLIEELAHPRWHGYDRVAYGMLARHGLLERAEQTMKRRLKAYARNGGSPPRLLSVQTIAMTLGVSPRTVAEVWNRTRQLS